MSSLFRMTSSDGKTNIATASLPDLGKWASREKATINLCVVLLAAFMHEHLVGARLPQLRRSMSVALLTNSRASLKANLSITIPNP